ncbi:MAG: hypothetical protein IT380_15925 [Myxococcales bacterium]|nr:hypothetical protein [Myxococcales bacterium]
MSDRLKKPGPQIEVIRRPAQAASTVKPTQPAPAPRPVAPRTATPAQPRPASPHPSGPRPAPAGARPAGGKPPFRAPRGPPRPPPTAEQIVALAKKERVPNRIAKGELEGKMKCRIWKKLHAEEARRFDQAFNVMEANPGLELADAFGVVQSGLPVADFVARRARAKKREEVKAARATVAGATVDELVAGWQTQKAELAVVMGERTALDVIAEIQPVAFVLERAGRVEKLNVVVIARKATWDAHLPTVTRDPKLSQKPAAVARQPARRPVNDPRTFLDFVGQRLTFNLRNGITVTEALLAVGPFDVLLGEPGEELFVPLHAMLSWSAA